MCVPAHGCDQACRSLLARITHRGWGARITKDIQSSIIYNIGMNNIRVFIIILPSIPAVEVALTCGFVMHGQPVIHGGWLHVRLLREFDVNVSGRSRMQDKGGGGGGRKR